MCLNARYGCIPVLVLLLHSALADQALIESLQAPTKQGVAGALTTLVYEAEAYTWNGDVVPDSDALNGSAVWATPGIHSNGHPYVFCSGQDAGLQPALYRVTFRLKIKDKPAVPRPVCRVSAYNHSGTTNPPHLYYEFKDLTTADFERADAYQEFSIPLERYDVAFAAFMVQWQKTVDLWVDRATLTVDHFFTDAEMVGNPRLRFNPATVLTNAAGRGRDVLVVAGPYHRKYRLAEALAGATNTAVDTCRAVRERALGGDTLKPVFPGDTGGGGLAKYKVVVLVDVPATPLHLAGRQALKTFVEEGGGLIVLGGPFAFGAGGYGPTFLQDMVPVTDDGPWGLQPAGRWSHRVTLAPHPLTVGLFSKEQPVASWYHRFRAKEDTTMVMSVRRDPLLVLGRYGQGRVAVLGATTLGKPPKRGKPLLACDDWPALLARLMEWAAGESVDD